jgi:hypothetical protein
MNSGSSVEKLAVTVWSLEEGLGSVSKVSMDLVERCRRILSFRESRWSSEDYPDSGKMSCSLK